MPKFRVNGEVVGGKYLGVFEANNAEEAIEKALNSGRCHVGLCHQCSEHMGDLEVEDATAEQVSDDEVDDYGS